MFSKNSYSEQVFDAMAVRSPQGPTIFFLGAYRSDEADASPFLSTWDQYRKTHQIGMQQIDISVGAFSPMECEELAVELLGKDNATIRNQSRELYEQTGGNPFLMSELIGCIDPATDSFRSIPIQGVIDEKLKRLPGDATRLLNVIAVSGRQLEMNEAAAVAGSTELLSSILTRMRSERLIRFLGSDETKNVDTYHDRIRETVLGAMDPETKQRLHRNHAEHIEAITDGLSPDELNALEQGTMNWENRKLNPRVFDLSFHFDAAQQSRRACAYGLLAAEQARGQFALEVAATQYEISLRHSDRLAPAARCQLQKTLGEISTLLARYDQADKHLRASRELAEDPMDQCEIELLQARQLIANCQYGASADQYVKTLQTLGIRVPQSTFSLVLGMTKQVIIQAAHTLHPPRRSRHSSPRRRESLIIQLLDGLSQAVWFRNTPIMLWCHLTGMNRAERYGMSKAVNFSYSSHAAMLSPLGFRRRAFRYADRALEEVDPADLAECLTNHFCRGVGLYAAARYEECKQVHLQGMELIERTGDMFKAMIMRLHIALSDFRLGQFQAALEEAHAAFQASIRLGDFNTAHDFINVVAMITDGDFAFEAMYAELSPIPDNFQATNQGMQAEARWHLHHDRTEKALRCAEQAFELARKKRVINHITMPNVPLLLRARLRHAESLKSSDGPDANRIVKKSFWLARVGVLLTKQFPDYAATLREAGRLYAWNGNLEKAIKLTEKSHRIALHQEMPQEAELSRLQLMQFRSER